MSVTGRIAVQIAVCCAWLILAATAAASPMSRGGMPAEHGALSASMEVGIGPSVVAEGRSTQVVSAALAISDTDEDQSHRVDGGSADAGPSRAFLPAALAADAARRAAHRADGRAPWLSAIAARGPPLA